MTHDIQPADPRFRRQFLVVMLCVAGLIAFGIRALDAYLLDLQALAETAPPTAAAKARELIRGVLIALVLSAAGVCAYLAWSSWRTLRSERFPPPGARVLSETPIRRGRKARRHGQAGLVFAALILALTVVVAFQAHRLLERTFTTELRPTPVYFDEPNATPASP